jgi:hypothetical protein
MTDNRRSFFLQRTIRRFICLICPLTALLVLWAQRSSSSDPAKNHVFLTLSVPDVPKDKTKLDLTESKLSFSGPSRKGVTYAVELEFYAPIDPKGTKINHTDRDIEMVIQKKDLKEEYWPRLLKDTKRMHFLKTDFDKVSIKFAPKLICMPRHYRSAYTFTVG